MEFWKKLTKERIIEKFNKAHSHELGSYSYEKVNFSLIKSDRDKILITCNKCNNDFTQSINKHFNSKHGCSKCSGNTKYTQEEFLKRVNTIHGTTYCYDKFVYNGAHKKGIIICYEHGEFSQTPHKHINGKRGCFKCSGRFKITLEEFIKKANIIHNNKYDYTKFIYKNCDSPGIIICPEHGEFLQSPFLHSNNESGCLKCSKLYRPSLQEFIEKANVIHNNKYDYTKFIYENCDTKGEIICPTHGSFLQSPYLHVNLGCGCKKCTTFISKSEIQWLDILNISEDNRQLKLPNLGHLVVDGYCPITATVFEFNGDYWHGNPEVFAPDKINVSVKKTFKELHEKTLKKEKRIKDAGYKLVSIWESNFKKLLKENLL